MTESASLEDKFERYLGTMLEMTASDPRTSGLSLKDIRTFWGKIPVEQKNGILLLAQFQEFFNQIHNRRSDTDQGAVIDRDKSRKKDRNFARFVDNAHKWCNELVNEGELKGFWYISQSGKTQLERDLDEAGIDMVIQKQDGEFTLIQFGTRFGDARDKIRHFNEKYGEGFELFPFIGVMPMRMPDEGQRDMTAKEFKIMFPMVIEDTRSFGPNLMASAFPHR